MSSEVIVYKSEFSNGKKIIFKEVHDTLGFIVFYDGESIKLYRNHCPHMGAKLEEKHFCSKTNSIICPWHTYKYEMHSGDLIENPAIQSWISHLVPEDSHFLKLRKLKLVAYPVLEESDLFRILIHEA